MSYSSILRKTENFIPDDFFIWMKPFYMLHGFLPPKEGIVRYIIYIIFRTIYFSTLALELVSQWFSIFIEYKKTGLEHITLQITVSMFSTIFHFRILMWLLNIDKWSQIVAIISRKSFNFKCFSLVSVQYSTNVHSNKSNDEVRNVLERYKYLSDLWNTNGIYHFGQSRYVQPILL